MKLFIHPLPYAADASFSIRDDDISYFSEPERLEKIYHQLWKNEFKVSFAVIPAQKGTNNLNVPPPYRNTDKYYVINTNKNVIDFLKLKIYEGKVDILQHGYSHTDGINLPSLKFDFNNGNLLSNNLKKISLEKYSEFYAINKKDISYKIGEGKNILEKTFGIQINTFVSPQQYLTRNLWLELWRNNLNYCGNVGLNIFKQIPINHIDYYQMIKIMWSIFKESIINNLKLSSFPVYMDISHITDMVIIPVTYRHYWNKFLNKELSEHWFNNFKISFKNIMEQNGNFLLLTHYWEYFYDWNEEMTQNRQYEYLQKIADYVNKNSAVWKCSVSELGTWLMKRNRIILRKKHNELKIFSPFDIFGLSIKVDKKIKVSNEKHIKIIERNGHTYAVFDIKAGQKVTCSI